MSKMIEDDVFGLGVSIPYYSIILTPEQAKKVEYSKISIYNIDGKTLFEVRDNSGKLTGEYTLFVTFQK